MALRIDHLNKKLAAFGVTLIREDDLDNFMMVHVDGETQEVEDVERINDWTEAEWMAAAEQFASEQVLEEGEEEDEEGNKMSLTLLKYRGGYVKAVSYTSGPTLDNGDAVAQALRGHSPEQVCAIADAIFGEPIGTHFERWIHLNIGQRRMNAGNRLRAAAKKDESILESIQKLIGNKAPDAAK